MSVIFVAEGFGSQDYTGKRADYGNLVAELILLMFLAFADALYLRFMQ